MKVRMRPMRNMNSHWGKGLSVFKMFTLVAAVLLWEDNNHDIIAVCEASSSNSNIGSKQYKLLQVQLVHRHGDRTPITPMRDEEFWSKSLPDPHILQSIAKGTNVVRPKRDSTNSVSTHGAAGKGVFGKLTNLGLLQMVQVGSRLRDELLYSNNGDDDSSDDGWGKYLFHPVHRPLHPQHLKVYSTDFPRTLQSVQALLVGMFPDGIVDEGLDIDAQHTNIMIPDPQPRLTELQVQLESSLSNRPHFLQREKEMKELARRVTQTLRDEQYLAEDADKISFGVGDEDEDDNTSKSQNNNRPLPWSQLSEITTCLRMRNRLPLDKISPADQEAITSHAAWRWFENMRDPELSKVAMCHMVQRMLQHSQPKATATTNDSHSTEDQDPLLIIYSAHDSSLIGLLCAFRLDQPAEWPEYGSCLKMELFEETNESNNDNHHAEYYVRFSLNGETLKCHWGLNDDNFQYEKYQEACDLIPWDVLYDSIQRDYSK